MRRASSPQRATTPTATRRRCATAWCARSSSSPTAAHALAHQGGRRDLGEPRHPDDEGPGRSGRRTASTRRVSGSAVLAAADKRLTEVRRGVPDAGGLVIASNQTQARAYAAQLRALTGDLPRWCCPMTQAPPSASRSSPPGRRCWMVAVRMVSEGVDVPRPLRGRVRHVDLHAALLRAGGGSFRPGPEAGRDGVRVPPPVPVVLDHAARLRSSATTRSTGAGDADVAAMWAEEQGLLDEALREEKATWPARRGRLRGARVRGPLRPRALRQAAGHARADRLRGGRGLPRPPPGCSNPTRSRRCSRTRQRRQVRKYAPARPSLVAQHRALRPAQGAQQARLCLRGRRDIRHANVHLDLRRAARPTCWRRPTRVLDRDPESGRRPPRAVVVPAEPDGESTARGRE